VRINSQEVKQSASGRWLEIIPQLAPQLAHACQKPGHHVKCHCHGNEDGFRMFDDSSKTGGGYCNQTGAYPDGLALLQWANGWDFSTTVDAVARVVGINVTAKPSPKIVATYAYKDENGKPLFEVVRFEPKDFRQRVPTGDGKYSWKLNGVRRVLYNLPAIVSTEKPVYIVEGEKDADRLTKEGWIATCCPGGAGKWKNEYNYCLKGRDVVILPDNDQPGRDHAKQVAGSLYGTANRIKIVTLQGLDEKGDVSDWLKTHSKDELFKVMKETPIYEPPTVEAEQSTEPKDTPNRPKTFEQFSAESGLDKITEQSTPEQVAEAVSKFSAISSNQSQVWIASAKSGVLKKLKDVKIQGASEIVKAAFKTQNSVEDIQGQALDFSDPEPWPDDVDGAALLNQIVEACNRFLVLPECGAEAIALWTIHAWAIDAAQISPVLILESPEKRCGKTTTLNLVGAVAPSSIPASSISPASLFRSVEKFQPTLLIDEADRALKNSDELNCIINASHNRQGAGVIRTVGEDHEPRRFSTWCPKAIAAIGHLQGTLEDRGIILQMRRKTQGEQVERWRGDRLAQFKPIKEQAFRWVQDNTESLKDLDPEVPNQLHDRAADNWRSLLAIADLVGGDWPDRSRKAALKISGKRTEEDSWGVQVLADIQDWFQTTGKDNFPSAEMCTYLGGLVDRPWPEYKNGKEITTRQLAKLLGRFEIKSKDLKQSDGSVLKGYTKKHFIDPFSRYLSATNATKRKNKDLDDFPSATTTPEVADKKQDNLFKNNLVADVAYGNPETGGVKEKEEVMTL